MLLTVNFFMCFRVGILDDKVRSGSHHIKYCSSV